MRSRTAIMGFLLLLAACGGGGSEDGRSSSTEVAAPMSATEVTSGTGGTSVTTEGTDTPDESTTPTPDGDSSENDLIAAVEAAKADLAHTLGMDEDAIEVVEATEVTWPDAGLGCPQPGETYAPNAVAGARILLKANGASYSYHGVAGGVPVVCDTPQVPPPIR